MTFSHTPIFPLDKRYLALHQTTHDFAQKEIAPLADSIDRTNIFPRSLWPLLGKQGLLGATISKKYGGSELGYLGQAIIVEAISRASGSIGLAYGAHANLCANQIFRFGTEAQKEKFLPKLNSGEFLGGLAMSEKDAGSDVVSMKLHAEEKSDHFILNGHKMWTSNGTDADVIVVYAKTNPELGAHGMSCFIIEKKFKGFHASKTMDKFGMRGCDTALLTFENCIVPKENLLGKLNDGVGILMSGLDFERGVLASGPVGLMQACLDLMIPYVKERKQFGKVIGTFEMIQEKIAVSFAQYQSIQNYLYAVVARCDQGIATSAEAAGVYLLAGEAATRVALDTIQCLGGVGYLNDSAAGRLLRDAKLYEIGAGTTEIRKIVVAREMLKEVRAQAST